MIRASLLLASAIGISAFGLSQAETVNQATIDALARSYSFGVVETAHDRCRVTLTATPARRASGRAATRPVSFNSACRKFASLRGVTHWAPTGGASVALFGGDRLHEIADFSPVQDGTGVYLRGGFAGDARLYELRPRAE
jgi:hypothetical protein